MPAAFSESLADFLPDDGPGVVVATYNAASVKGIFERQFIDQFNVQTSAPTFLAAKTDLAAVAQGQSITINAVTYTVAQFEHDPVGYPDWTLLLLQV